MVLNTLIAQQANTIKFLKEQEALLLDEIETLKINDMGKIDKIEMVLLKEENVTLGKEQLVDENPSPI